MTALSPIPVRPVYPDTRIDAAQALYRLAAAHVIAAIKGPGHYPEPVLRAAWPRDTAALALYQKAAVTAASTTVSGWASEIAATSVAAFVGSLRDSAAAVLIARGLRVDMDGVASVTLPRATSTGTAGWVAEGAPIPMAAGVLSASATISPRKLAVIETLTRETFTHSNPAGAEDWMSVILRDAASYQLDQALFSNTAGSSTQPPGLVAGVSALTATTGGGLSACTGDFRLITDAIVTAGGGGEILYFMSPGRALAAKSLLPAIAPQIFGSAAIASATLIGVAVGAFASGFDAVPNILASQDAIIHEDTAPLQIGTVGSPATVAAPTRSFFQTDVIGFRMILKAGWALRIPATAQWISTGMTW